ncbi:MAG: GGDEF domain-containing protein [Pseudomonadota bacterium]
MKFRKLSLEELLPMLLAFAGIAGIAPFVVVRLLDGDFAVAALDAVLVCGLAAIAWAVYKHRAVRLGSVLMALICMGAVIATNYLRGGTQALWAYPGLVAMFYLLRPMEAAIVSIISLAVLTPVMIDGRDAVEVGLLMATLGVTLALSVGFAAMTNGQRRQLQQLTMVDPLTGAGNRRALDDALAALINEARTNEVPVALIMLDVDHFKRVNDIYGHATGDRVLTDVTTLISSAMRSSDNLYRVGGEEFVILAQSSGLDIARRLGESLRVRIAEMQIEPEDQTQRPFGITVSLGVAELLPGETGDAWYRRADDALYEAKRSGRNRICLAEKTVSLSGSASYSVEPEPIEAKRAAGA